MSALTCRGINKGSKPSLLSRIIAESLAKHYTSLLDGPLREYVERGSAPNSVIFVRKQQEGRERSARRMCWMNDDLLEKLN